MKKPKIVMVGIGKAGITVLNIIKNRHEHIETIAIDSSSDDLRETVANHKIELEYEPIIGLGYFKPALIKFLRGKSKEEIDAMREESLFNKK